MTQGILGPIVRVRLSSLNTYPGNARRGDVEAIAKSLEVNGQFQPLIVQKSSDNVLIGNHTMRAMRKIRWAECDAAYLDVDDDEARKIVLAANRTGDLATYDLDALAELLNQVDDLEGTGFTNDDLAGLLEEPGTGDPDTTEREKPVRLGVVIYTNTEAEQMELMAEMLEQGYDARAL